MVASCRSSINSSSSTLIRQQSYSIITRGWRFPTMVAVFPSTQSFNHPAYAVYAPIGKNTLRECRHPLVDIHSVYTGCLMNFATLFFSRRKTLSCIEMKFWNRDFQEYNSSKSLKKLNLLNFSKKIVFLCKMNPFLLACAKKEAKKRVKPRGFMKKSIFKDNATAPTNQVLYLRKFDIL